MSPEDALKNLLSRANAIIKDDTFALALPASGNDIFTTPLTPTNSEFPVLFRVYANISKSGTLSATITRGGTTATFQLNDGVALTPDLPYSFDIPISHGDDFNLKYSVANGTIHILRVTEIPEGI